MIKKGFTIFLLFLLGLSVSNAQESINSSGGEAYGNGGTFSYSVGQIAYSVNSAVTGSITEGVQQPYEISVISSIETLDGISLQCIAYPNPVIDRLSLSIENPVYNNLSFNLIGPDGSVLINKKIIDVSTTIPMQDLVPASYFLIIYQKDRAIKTFQIIKK
jgi:hypothetical protein